ncbi:hypothetical protein tb265_39990 [Gemmatimonadetes bacterium T265]|nr:hypothetical protein tb265_39990 [Gemmatimonadetes bacterium T265]
MGAIRDSSPPAARSPERPSPELPHKYVGGDPSVDFVNTVDWTSGGLLDERLDDYARLTRWAEGAGVLPPALGAALRDAARARPADAAAALAAAHALRGALQRVFADAAAGRPLGAALAALDPSVAAAAGQRRLEPAADAAEGAAARWAWRDADARLDAPLWPVAWHAAELLASAEAARLRVCGAADCGWMYVDRSRNGLRRWCQMEVCGTRAKSRRRADRQRATGQRATG